MLVWLWRHRLYPAAKSLALAAAAAVVLDILLRTISKHTNGAFHGTPWHLTTGAPSGHACVSMVVYGSIGALFVGHAKGATRWIAGLLALAILVAVDVTRITLSYHSPFDVSTGVLLGGIFVLLVVRTTSLPAVPWPPMGRLLVALVIVGALMQLSGVRFDSNAVL
jgi:membrane-associated phospholipid phosphatase